MCPDETLDWRNEKLCHFVKFPVEEEEEEGAVFKQSTLSHNLQVPSGLVLNDPVAAGGGATCYPVYQGYLGTLGTPWHLGLPQLQG